MENNQLRIDIQNFLNFVCMETFGNGGDSDKLEGLLEDYLEEGEDDWDGD